MKEPRKTPVGTKAAKISAAAGTILAAVLLLEGGYVNNPSDPGGETNYGITKMTALANGYTGVMREMPKEFAWSVYHKQYLVGSGYEPLLQHSPAVVEELVDTAVNTGISRSSTWFQKALNSLSRGGKDYPLIVVDGVVSGGTISAYVSLVNVRGKGKACELIIKLMDAQQAAHYVSLTKLVAFTPGWIDHRIGNVNLAKCTN